MNKQTPKYIEHVTLAITFIDNLRQFLRKKDLDAESANSRFPNVAKMLHVMEKDCTNLLISQQKKNVVSMTVL